MFYDRAFFPGCKFSYFMKGIRAFRGSSIDRIKAMGDILPQSKLRRKNIEIFSLFQSTTFYLQNVHVYFANI